MNMNLTDEDIERIRSCLLDLSDEGLKEMRMSFWNAQSSERTTAWKDYRKCRHMEQGIIPYSFATPVEFVGYLESLWKTDDNAYKSLIMALTVGVFRQKQSVEKAPEVLGGVIPTYIYNF